MPSIQRSDLVIDVHDGELRFVYDDDLVELLAAGESRVTRASHVEPADGGWRADLTPVGGPVLGVFALRKDALDAEVAWLRDNPWSLPHALR